MSALAYCVLAQLERLPLWRRVWRRLCQIHDRLNKKYATHPGLRGWLWRLTHTREWQKSSALSALIWAFGTIVLFRIVALLGHGWEVNALVSLSTDVLVYTINKLWIWKRRRASLPVSVSWSFVWWLGFFVFNLTLFWLIKDQADTGTQHARYILGAWGVLMNPIVFKFRDRVAFKEGDRTTAAV